MSDGNSPKEKRGRAAALATLALPIALIALIPALVGIVLLHKQDQHLHDLIVQNDHRITDIQELRRAASAVNRSDQVAICQAVNTITRRDRATFAQSAASAVPILRKLHFTKEQISAYLASSRAEARAEIKRRPLIEGGDCTKLPNPANALPGTKKKKPKSP